MRVFLPVQESDKPKTGKGFFCLRLAKSLSAMGHKIVKHASDSHDVSLHIVKIREGKGKKVLRLDGVCHNNAMNIKVKNKELARALRGADGVVYQSEFSKKLCDKYLGKFKGPTCVISNGADPAFYNNIAPQPLKTRNNFISASRWRPHKRLPDIIESFRLAAIEDSCLYVAGDLSKIRTRHKDFSGNIVYLGKIGQKALGAYLKACKGFVHLCWFDNCPNAVVEAIVAGVPVITNNVGGTHEIVRPSGGIICEIDKPCDLSPVRLYHPPVVDQKRIADAMLRCVEDQMEVTCDHVHIDSIASRYSKFFEELCR